MLFLSAVIAPVLIVVLTVLATVNSYQHNNYIQRYNSYNKNSNKRTINHNSYDHKKSYNQFHTLSSRLYNVQQLFTLDHIRVAESGAVMDIKGVSLSVGNNDLITGIEWPIMPKDRWALVGRNGAGKSTLLKALTGHGGENVNVREGHIGIAKKARMGYLEQKGVSGSTMTVREEVSSRMDRLRLATEAYNTAEKRVVDGDTSDEALLLLEETGIEFEAAGGYTVDQKISNVLTGLGFVESDFDKPCSTFSGGWQMRIALARLLLSEPDLLLLDEPTNHLDKGARDWLGQYLSKYDGTLLLVSHDTNLLQAAVNSIAEVRHGKLELYKSRSHDQWVIEREERVRAAQAAFEANQREIARLQGFVDRFGAKTMGASLAQSKLKTIEKLEQMTPEAPMEGDGAAPVLRLPPPPRGSKVSLQLKNVALSWDAKCPADQATVRDCSITIERGMRVVVRGPNGAGKTTILSALSGRLTPLVGDRIEGDGLELGVFTQDLAQDLDPELSAVDTVTSVVRQKDPTLSDERARSVLGALGLTGEKALRQIKFLSGGEKARVALASFVLIPHNILLLDEPSNHLDVTTLNVLSEALRTYEGAIVVISHDRQFLEELDATHVLTVRGGRASLEERSLQEKDWDDPLDSRSDEMLLKDKFATNTITAPAESVKKAETTSSKVVDSPELRKKKLNAPKRIKKIENSLEKHQKEMAKIDEDMLANGRNRSKLLELQVSKEQLQAKIDKLYVEYEELAELVE